MKEDQTIQNRIFLVRGSHVMLDQDLANLYGVKVKTLNQSVKRNSMRFPEDFMFQLSPSEWNFLRSQFVTLENDDDGRGKHVKYLPNAFTQNGIAMLSSVLHSDQAIAMNIRIMRIFVKSGEFFRNQAEVMEKLQELEKRGLKNSEDIMLIFQAIKELYGLEKKTEDRRIGF